MDPHKGLARDHSLPEVATELPPDQALRQPLLHSSSDESEAWSLLSGNSPMRVHREFAHASTQCPSPADEEAVPAPQPDPDVDEESIRRRARHHCLQLCCARLCCSWCCKCMVLVVVVNAFFLSGPLSKPMWIPISQHAACENCDDLPRSADAFRQEAPMEGGLAACEALCSSYSDCQAVDWFNTTRWCNLYTQPCLKPTANWDGASSYQIAVSCTLFNGTSGVMIGGQCMAGIEIPTTWSVVKREIPKLLSSPRSWLCSLSVALIYTYVTSSWLRGKTRPVVLWITPKGPRGRSVLAWLLLLLGWWAFTYHEFGLPTMTAKEESAEGGIFGQMALEQKLWYGVSFLALFLLCCPCSRSIILSGMLSLGTCIMSAFMSAVAFALSGCIDVTAATAAIGGATAAGVTEATVAAEGTLAGGAALEAGVAADGAMGAEGAVAADTAAGGAAAAEGATAAEAAVAADAAVAAEAATVAEGLGALALCAIQ